jgi:hypothetical protein
VTDTLRNYHFLQITVDCDQPPKTNDTWFTKFFCLKAADVLIH